ncbi:MAG: DUF819 family protein [Flavobacteriales bacterium]|jgi:uncharacterized membrane protein|nr:DUF819 family protein [Flavobacteriales bacterium]
MTETLFTNKATVFGVLAIVLAFVFYTSSKKEGFWSKFYKIIPALLMCYFLPAILNTLNIISAKDSKDIYYIATRFMLPAALVLLTLSIDLKGIFNLGPKAIIMFLTGTAGIVIGGPLTILIVSSFAPEWVGGAGPEAVWRGMTTVAGSWIGGGANQVAMKEVFNVNDAMFSKMIIVDVLVANVWMAFLLFGIGKKDKIDHFLKADTTAIETLKNKMIAFQDSISKNPTLTDLMVILGIAFGITGFSHYGADILAPWISENLPFLNKFSLGSSFFWLIVLATTGGVILSFTRLRNYEGAGASKIGSVFIYFLVASIGMKMDILAIFDNPELFVIGLIWMAIHVLLLFVVAKIIKAPYFFVAVGSKANIGGAASAPVVAGAFHPSLAPVGVLLAVLGYALGTYAALICGQLMQVVAP